MNNNKKDPELIAIYAFLVVLTAYLIIMFIYAYQILTQN